MIASILEVGCGNGLLYQEIKKKFNNVDYVGFDFVGDLIDYADRNKIDSSDTFQKLDMTLLNETTFNKKFDFIISKRAIQNIIDQEMQVQIIDNLGVFLNENGLMALVESSQNAQNNINDLRNQYQLEIITPPFHNLFFDDKKMQNHNYKNVKLENIDPFSSDFYYITRLVYALYAKKFLNEKPTFNHPLQNVASQLSRNCFTKSSRNNYRLIFILKNNLKIIKIRFLI